MPCLQIFVEPSIINFDAENAKRIIQIVGSYFGFKEFQLKSRGRPARLALARQIAMSFLFSEVGLNKSEIGRMLGGRDHATVAYAINRVSFWEQNDKKIRNHLIAVRGLISGRITSN